MSNHQFSFPNLICHVSVFIWSPLPSYLGAGEGGLQPEQQSTELAPDFLHLGQLLPECVVSPPQLLNYRAQTRLLSECVEYMMSPENCLFPRPSDVNLNTWDFKQKHLRPSSQTSKEDN